MSFAGMIALEAHGDDRFTARGPRYPWGFLYGGQVAAQAVRAAAATVRSEETIHSLHAYYARAGDDERALELAVQRVRDGRSFSIRSVTASQSGRSLATVTASFHVEERSDERSVTSAPTVPPASELRSDGWSTLFDRRYACATDSGRTLAWLRLNEELPDEPSFHACALTYMADDLFDDPVIGALGVERPAPDSLAGADGSILTQSLDYSVWFHRPARADEWLLFDFGCRTLANACAMVVGDAFDGSGAHVATMAQQVLVRDL
jgi:acyl-CoA thioesterase-2